MNVNEITARRVREFVAQCRADGIVFRPAHKDNTRAMVPSPLDRERLGRDGIGFVIMHGPQIATTLDATDPAWRTPLGKSKSARPVGAGVSWDEPEVVRGSELLQRVRSPRMSAGEAHTALGDDPWATLCAMESGLAELETDVRWFARTCSDEQRRFDAWHGAAMQLGHTTAWGFRERMAQLVGDARDGVLGSRFAYDVAHNHLTEILGLDESAEW